MALHSNRPAPSRVSAKAAPASARRSRQDYDEPPARGRKGSVAVRKTVKRRAVKEKDPVTAGLKPLKKKFKQAELFAYLAEEVSEATNSEFTPKDVKTVIGMLAQTAFRSTMPGSLESFMVPGLFKIVVKHKAKRKVTAIKAGTMLPNPFNGGKVEPHKGRDARIIPAKVVPKILPQGKLKLAVAGL